jgi:integrase
MAGSSQNALPYNDQAVAKFARSRVDKATERKVAGVPGLSIVVKPHRDGHRVATFLVRYQIGKSKARVKRCEAIGRHEDASGAQGGITLADAKAKALAIMSEVAHGGDPTGSKAKGPGLTLRELFEERREKDSRRAERTLDDYKLVLEADVFPEIGNLPANSITPDQIADVLERIEARSKHAAHKARSALGSTYRWGMGRRKVRINPVAGLGFTYRGKERKRILSDDEMGRLWRTIDGPEFAETTEGMRILLKLGLLTLQRNSEVAGARLSELEAIDTANPRWRIPGERMKRKNREQVVPLSPQAAALFKRAIELAKGSEYVFPGRSQGRQNGVWRDEHIGQESVSQAMRRAIKRAEVKDFRLHDARKCGTTWLRDNQKAPPDVCDLILHHARGGTTASHYDFATLEGPVRSALVAWANHVENVAVQKEKAASNVRPLVRG